MSHDNRVRSIGMGLRNLVFGQNSGSVARLARLFALSAVVLGLLSVRADSAHAQRRGRLGIGISFGDPTALTIEYRRGRRGFGHALEIDVGIDRFDEDRFYAHLLWKFYLADLVRGRSVVIPFYTAIGPFLIERDGVDLGVRVPFGLAFDFRRAPIQLFAELAVELEVVDDLDTDIGGAVGFRWFF